MQAKSAAGQEQARLLRAQDLGNLEVLQATYTKHSFARHTHEEFVRTIWQRLRSCRQRSSGI